MHNILAIDGNNICYRAYHKFKHLSAHGKSTALVYGVPRIIQPIVRKFSPFRVYVTFDMSLCHNRMELLTSYKGTRQEKKQKKYGFDREDFERQKRELIKLLPHLGLDVLYADGEEADDIIYTIVKRQAKLKSRRTIIVSTDKDFHQLISKRVWVWHLNKIALLKPHNLNYHFGWQPHEVIDYLSLAGDSSDNIPGIPGVGEKTAKEFLDKYRQANGSSSIDAFLKTTDSFPRLNREILEDKLETLRLLIDLEKYHDTFVKSTKLPIQKAGEFNPKKLAKLGKKYNTKIFTDDKFLEPFTD